MAQSALSITEQLEAMCADVRRGMHSANLRIQLLPAALMRVLDTVMRGDAQALHALIFDVAGESISLAAGASVQGGQAMQAVGLAQAMELHARRQAHAASNVEVDDWTAATRLLHAHQTAMKSWIHTGKSTVLPHGDLAQMGGELL